MPKTFQDYSDDRHKGRCFHCGFPIGTHETNREHIPTKSLLVKPFPRDLPVIKVCSKCNESYSKDEEYLSAFISAVLSGTVEPDQQKLEIGRRVFSRNSALKNRIQRSKREFETLSGGRETVWMPETKRIERIAEKNARAHAFFENGEPMFTKPTQVLVFPLVTAADDLLAAFFGDGGSFDIWPEVGSRWMQRLLAEPSFDSDGFFLLQPDVYRFRLEFCAGLTVKSILHEYLATWVSWD